MTRQLATRFAAGTSEAQAVLAFREEHELGRPPELVLDVFFADDVDPNQLLGETAQLDYALGEAPPQRFVGVVGEITVIGNTKRGAALRYRLKLVTPLGLLGQNVQTRLFQGKTIQALVTEVLTGGGLPPSALRWRLASAYAPRAYVVQYQESDLAFVSRLLEQEGIFFFVEPDTDEGLVYVFADESSSAEPVEGETELPWADISAMQGDEDAVQGASDEYALAVGSVTLRDVDFERPELDLTANAPAGADETLSWYEHPGGYKEPDEGKRLARVRLEAARGAAHRVVIEAEAPRVRVGRQLTLADGPKGLDGAYLVVRVVHELVEGPASGPRRYRTHATLQPLKTPFRTPQQTPKPCIEGPQSARVVAPEGAQPEAIHADALGRCKVKFAWDVGPVFDDKASHWVRVAQLQTSGSMLLPRLDWEVLVDYTEGDPDRPVVVGRLMNGLFMPPYALPEGKTRTVLRSASTPGGGGVNEVRFEDKAGAEEIMIAAQYDKSVSAANNSTKTVGNCETLVVGQNASMEVGAVQTVKVTKGYKNSIAADRSVVVGTDRSVEVNAVSGLTVGGNNSTRVGGSQREMCGNPLEALLALAAERAIAFAAATAGQTLRKVDAAVQGKLVQALGPVNQASVQAQALGGGMQALARGDLGAAGSVLAGASGLPGAAALVASAGGGGGGGGGRDGAAPANGGDAGAGNLLPSLTRARLAVREAAGGGIQSMGEAARNVASRALGKDAGGGGSSLANVGGPEGSVEGVDEADREKGPGHATFKVNGAYQEHVGSMKVALALDDVTTNVAGSMKRTVDAAHIQMVLGDHITKASSGKREKALGLVVVTSGNETEASTGAKTSMVGGAIVEKVQGNHIVQAGAGATFVGALHKVEASGSITFKCGASEVVIDGGGVTIKSALVTLTAGKIQLPKATYESGLGRAHQTLRNLQAEVMSQVVRAPCCLGALGLMTCRRSISLQCHRRFDRGRTACTAAVSSGQSMAKRRESFTNSDVPTLPVFLQ